MASVPSATRTKLAGVTPIRLPGAMTPAPWLADATKVVAYRHEGAVVIVAAGIGWLRWFSSKGEKLGERKGEGAPQLLKVVDLYGDGKMRIVFARGMGRGVAKADLVVEVLDLSMPGGAAQSLEMPKTSRSQAVGVAKALDDSLWVASFVSKFEVEVARYARDEKNSESSTGKKESSTGERESSTGEKESSTGEGEAWSSVEKRGRYRVVADLVVSEGMPLIARMYGDDPDAAGGVFAIPPTGAPVQLPSTRGARALLALPGGRVAMADGWHKNYGKRAQGLVSLAQRHAETWRPVPGVEITGIYGYDGLRAGNVHRNQGGEILAVGNGPVVVILPKQPDFVYKLGDVEALDAAAIHIDGDERDEVVIVGPTPVIWSAR